MMEWYGGHMTGPGWALMLVLMCLGWAGVVLLGVLVLRGGRRDSGSSTHGTATKERSGEPRSSALEVLEHRYARGEIDHDEFELRRAALHRD